MLTDGGDGAHMLLHGGNRIADAAAKREFQQRRGVGGTRQSEPNRRLDPCLAERPQPLLNGADALAPGETSAPVKSQYGWHVIRVLPASYALLTDQVQQAYSQIAQSTFNTWFQKKLEKAVVKIDSAYGVWAKGKNGYAVTSKAAPKVRQVPTKSSGPQGNTGATNPTTP